MHSLLIVLIVCAIWSAVAAVLWQVTNGNHDVYVVQWIMDNMVGPMFGDIPLDLGSYKRFWIWNLVHITVWMLSWWWWKKPVTKTVQSTMQPRSIQRAEDAVPSSPSAVRTPVPITPAHHPVIEHPTPVHHNTGTNINVHAGHTANAYNACTFSSVRPQGSDGASKVLKDAFNDT